MPIDLHSLNAKDVVLKRSLSFYEKGMEFFYQQLVHLNVNIFILDHVLTFPWDVFTGPEDSLFFRMVFENFFYASLLIITRITTDQGVDPFTLPRFKNKLRQCIKKKYQPDFDSQLRSSKFDKATKQLLEKAISLRNQRVAHVSEKVALGKAKDTIITFGDIKSLRDTLNSLLDTLSFNVGHLMLPIQYHPDVRHPSGTDARPDIEKILDSIAYGSVLLNMAENNPRAWTIRRSKLTKEMLDNLNRYRTKFGLSEV